MTKRETKSRVKPQVCVISLWKNDAERRIKQRAEHLLKKTYPAARFLWVVGDSVDQTEDMLNEIAAESARDIQIVTIETDDDGDTPDHRLERLSKTVNAAFGYLRDDDQHIMIHESDLISQPDIIERLLALPGDVGAGMVYLGGPPFFYDTYAYRANGRRFGHDMPYHPVFTFYAPFEVDCVGSVWTAPAEDFRGADGIRANKGAVIDLMGGLKARGRQIFVDPSITIIQPKDLWRPFQHGSA